MFGWAPPSEILTQYYTMQVPADDDLYRSLLSSTGDRIMNDLPTHSEEAELGELGVRLVEAAIHDEMKWIFRVKRKLDVGVDGEIEMVNADRKATGRLIAAQVKCGDSYLKKRSRDGIWYHGEISHLNYWLRQLAGNFVSLIENRIRRPYWLLTESDIQSGIFEVEKANDLRWIPVMQCYAGKGKALDLSPEAQLLRAANHGPGSLLRGTQSISTLGAESIICSVACPLNANPVGGDDE